MPDRDYDVVLYGASGFTGRQTVRYFAENAPPSKVRWAIAGRNREKLEAVKRQVGGVAKDVDILVADSRDQTAVDAIVSRTRVMPVCGSRHTAPTLRARRPGSEISLIAITTGRLPTGHGLFRSADSIRRLQIWVPTSSYATCRGN